jgi:ADP-heptose:LPS heptosyltransferase
VNGARIGRGERIAIFWGGGLGDILALRPLLLALEDALDAPPDFFSTATHMQGLFRELGLRVTHHVLPAEPMAALRYFRSLDLRFDRLYLGAYPRIKTRMLAHVVGAVCIWSRRHSDVHPFVGEQVLADIKHFGLGIAEPYGGGARLPRATLTLPRDYMLFHPGAKARWETTRWPADHWRTLLQRVLDGSGAEVMLVGVEAERAELESLLQGLDGSARGRVRIETALPLAGLVTAVEGSRGVVCHNSGVLHLSAALGRPTVALTGSSARFWRPPYAHVQNVTSGACELACNQYRCPVPFYRARCIRELRVAPVFEALRPALG